MKIYAKIILNEYVEHFYDYFFLTGNHIFYKCGDFSSEQFRSYRIVNIRKVEDTINRSLSATEQEVLLFPRICNDPKCREYKYNKLKDCENCGSVGLNVDF